MNKFHKTEALIATLTLTVFTAGTVFAAPPGPPPTPNAPSASFSSVSVTNNSGHGISSTTNDAGSYAGIRGVGQIFGVIGSAVSMGGYFSGGTYGLVGENTSSSGTGVRGVGKGSGAGVAGYNDDATPLATGIFGRALGASGYGARLTGGLYGLLAEASQAAGNGALIRNFDGTKSVTLGNNTYAINAIGNSILNGDLRNTGNLDVNGYLQNSSGTLVLGDNIQVAGNSNFQNPVGITSAGGTNIGLTVNGRIRTGDASNLGGVWLNSALTQFIGQIDSNNVGVWNNGWFLQISNSGALSNPSGDLKLNDTIDATGNIVNTNNFWGFNWPVIVDDGLNVSGSATFSSDVAVTGRIKASGIGKIYNKNGPQVAAGTIPGNSVYALPAVVCNNTNDRMLSCRHSTGAGNGNTLVDAGSSIFGRTCIQYVRNTSASTYNYDITDAEGICFDPNDYWQ